jgi:23S rRNA (guanine745-N1)-methyltransferase
MLDSRAALLATGAYAPIAEAVAEAVAMAVPVRDPAGRVRARTSVAPAITPTFDATGSAAADAGGLAHSPAEVAATGLSVADLGCGTGYYAASVVDRVPVARLLAADRSSEAVRATLRALSGRVPPTGVVLDLWRPLPLRDASADVLLDVFAPRNPPEYARVLAPGGALIVVVPSAEHLSGLRDTAGMLDIPDGKATLVADQFATAGLQLSASTRIEYVIEADASTRALIAGMGPSAHHRARGGTAAPVETSARDQPFASIEASAHAETSTVTRGAAPRREAGPRNVSISVDVLTLRAP